MNELKKVNTNILFNREVWEEAKIYAIKNGMSLAKLVEKAVIAYMKGNDGRRA